MRFCVAIFAVLSLVATTAVSQNVPSEADQALRAVMDEVWEFELRESPMLATNAGDPRGQDRLADDRIEAIDRRNDARKEFLKRVTAFRPETLSELSQIDQELLRLRLEGQLADHRFQTHLMSINNREGFHVSFPELPHEMNPKTPQQYQNYISRLRDFGRYADEQIALLRLGIEAGLTQPSIVMRDSVGQAMSHVVDDPNESLLMTNLSTGESLSARQ